MPLYRLKSSFTDCLKAARDDDALILLEIEFHSFSAETENDLSKIDVLDLGTNKEPSSVDCKVRSCVSNIGVSNIGASDIGGMLCILI